ncbi:MAG TPA: RelA/SpoT domain-containing protein [Steroidobacteraceae bacterium]|jgi:ppGpp synthetase/RelA/SpoT-type nucleotidyltranferase
MTKSLKDLYRQRYEKVLLPIAGDLEEILTDHLKSGPHIDRITVRAKTPKSFLAKAATREKGALKYKDPLGEIQDQLGARIVVFYTSDVRPISRSVTKYFRHIEMLNKEPKSESEFGYFGKHFILALPEDAIPRRVKLEAAPKVFELQVRTLYQHAWSEASHDIGYKPGRKLKKVQKRNFALTAAQSWGADRIFQELHKALRKKNA